MGINDMWDDHKVGFKDYMWGYGTATIAVAVLVACLAITVFGVCRSGSYDFKRLSISCLVGSGTLGSALLILGIKWIRDISIKQSQFDHGIEYF